MWEHLQEQEVYTLEVATEWDRIEKKGPDLEAANDPAYKRDGEKAAARDRQSAIAVPRLYDEATGKAIPYRDLTHAQKAYQVELHQHTAKSIGSGRTEDAPPRHWARGPSTPNQARVPQKGKGKESEKGKGKGKPRYPDSHRR